MREIKANIEYYVKRHTPRELVRLIYQIFEKIGYLRLKPAEIRKLYQQKARRYMAPILSTKGFDFIQPGEFKVGGIAFDIYSEAESQRTMQSRIKRAFGEAKSIKCTKKLAEDYVHKMRDLKAREYRPERGDYPFLISPEITPDARRVLEDEGIDWIMFNPPEIQEYLKLSEDIQVEEVPIFRRKEKSRFSLRDIKGIAGKTEEKLIAADIKTIEDLTTCNPKLVSATIKRKFPRGIGEGKIKSFQQLAKELLEST